MHKTVSSITRTLCHPGVFNVQQIYPSNGNLLSWQDFRIKIRTFSCISVVDCASQNATVAISFRIGISTEQSRPSRSAIRGRGCIGPFGIGPRAPDTEKVHVKLTEQETHFQWGWSGINPHTKSSQWSTRTSFYEVDTHKCQPISFTFTDDRIVGHFCAKNICKNPFFFTMTICNKHPSSDNPTKTMKNLLTFQTVLTLILFLLQPALWSLST